MLRTLWFILYSFLCGHLLLIFTWYGFSLIRYVFSIGALYTGYLFFRQFKTKGWRIGFFAMVIVFYFILTFVYVIIGKIPILNLEPPQMPA